MNRVTAIIRGWLGRCPNASRQKSRASPVQEPEGLTTTPAPLQPADPSSSGALSAGSHHEYQENVLLIILLLGGLFYAWDLRTLALGGILSAIVVYYDAGTLHAGQKFEEESFFGDVVAWRPHTWAIWVFIGSLFFLVVYVFSRKAIFHANN